MRYKIDFDDALESAKRHIVEDSSEKRIKTYHGGEIDKQNI